ncbi:uncharacterized protein L3040_000197 [Drepanopeziza brunnea f. sp. 'multigermtubi']|uniref:uncharacterized protein n=1 Tax=Drepanopeziza brunnea f. sp. 'multigermtubi' TaxID=698441 RepID=UPI00239952BA|nr:hypothetical protein L3040_000197 [Drepanopeziza brunnea f. sp. 'multigermtubi']
MDKTQAELIDEYSQSIESSTILAILSDYDISNPSDLSQARQTLDILKASASTEESSGFDPSGASGIDFTNENQSSRGEDSSTSTSQRKSQTDSTSVSQDPQTLDLEGLDLGTSIRDESPEKPYPSELDGLDEVGKEKALIGIFPALKPFDITWTLRKCKWDAGQAIDELMTQAFLEESGSRHRGIEAFSESEVAPRQRKGKGKKKRKGGETSNPTSPASPVAESPVESKWNLGKQDIDFLSEKTGFPVKQISSIYHNHGGSLRASIAAIIQAHAAMGIDSDDPVIKINAFELREEFPSVSTSDLETLLQITHPSVADARELLQALAAPTTSRKNSIQIEFRHAPIQLEPAPRPKPKLQSVVYPDRPLDVARSAQITAEYSQARNTAFAQAQAAYRKGKSSPLMGGAAAYYSQVGRDLDAKVKIAASAAADALVASQSTRLELDLHGMNVKDALRISREAVTRWWHESSEERKAHGKGGAVPVYKIVTGAGNHSSGGHGKLGPAVGKMLLREGWNIQVGSRGNNGFLLVTGVAKRR